MSASSEAQGRRSGELFARDPLAKVRRPDGSFLPRMPNGLSVDQMRAIGQRGARLLTERLGDLPICLVGVANRGVPIAVSVGFSLPQSRVAFSLISRSWDDDKVDLFRASHKFVIVDNTIKTGATLRRVAGLLRERDIKPCMVMTFFHSELEEALACDLEIQLGLPREAIIPLYSADEIIVPR